MSAHRLQATVAVALAALSVACGGSDGGGDAGPTGAVVLVNGEGAQHSYFTPLALARLQLSLVGNGFHTDTTSDLTPGGLRAALVGKAVLIIPPANPDVASPVLEDSLPLASRDLIRQFADSGGVVVRFGGGTQGAPHRMPAHILNTLFGYGLTMASFSYYYQNETLARGPAATGTPFGAAPATIPGVNATWILQSSGLPPQAVAIYSDSAATNPGVAVTVLGYGGGRVVYYGWDWSDPAGVTTWAPLLLPLAQYY